MRCRRSYIEARVAGSTVLTGYQLPQVPNMDDVIQRGPDRCSESGVHAHVGANLRYVGRK